MKIKVKQKVKYSTGFLGELCIKLQNCFPNHRLLRRATPEVLYKYFSRNGKTVAYKQRYIFRDLILPQGGWRILKDNSIPYGFWEQMRFFSNLPEDMLRKIPPEQIFTYHTLSYWEQLLQKPTAQETKFPTLLDLLQDFRPNGNTAKCVDFLMSPEQVGVAYLRDKARFLEICRIYGEEAASQVASHLAKTIPTGIESEL